MSYPAGFRYTKQHEWVDVQGDVGTIGITDYAQRQLGDIVFVDLPVAGTVLQVGKSLGAIESVKAVSDIYAPVSGQVIEANDQLRDAPEGVNSDPHGAGWLVKVRLQNPAELASLMNAAAYEASLPLPDQESSH
jgi:glycine cleavage system H protein